MSETGQEFPQVQLRSLSFLQLFHLFLALARQQRSQNEEVTKGGSSLAVDTSSARMPDRTLKAKKARKIVNGDRAAGDGRDSRARERRTACGRGSLR
jgi:hypothetical protein